MDVTQGNIQARAAAFSNISQPIREMSEANGCSITVDFREKGFYSSFTPLVKMRAEYLSSTQENMDEWAKRVGEITRQMNESQKWLWENFLKNVNVSTPQQPDS